MGICKTLEFSLLSYNTYIQNTYIYMMSTLSVSLNQFTSFYHSITSCKWVNSLALAAKFNCSWIIKEAAENPKHTFTHTSSVFLSLSPCAPRNRQQLLSLGNWNFGNLNYVLPANTLTSNTLTSTHSHSHPFPLTPTFTCAASNWEVYRFEI